MSVTGWLLAISAIFIFCFLTHVLSNHKIYRLSMRLPGPTTFPIIGNAFVFACSNEDIFERTVAMISRYSSPMRFWCGPKFLVIFSEAEQAAKILSCMNFASKDPVYKFIKTFNGEGLISASGPKWKRDRRLMSSLFIKNSVGEYFSTVRHHVNVLLEKLETEVGQPAFNVENYLHRCVSSFVNESVIGVKSDAQNGTQLDPFLDAIDRMYELVHSRMVKPWLQVEWLFKLTPYWKDQEEARELIHGFYRNALKLGEGRRGAKSCGSFLDKILDIRNNCPEFASDEEIVHHLSTLYSASEDTVTTISAFTLVLMGMYPKIQDKVIEEIHHVLGNKNQLELDDLSKLVYQEMCIRDVLRLFPIAPFIMRTSAEDFQIDEWSLPKGCSTVVSIHHIHRNSKYWEKPNEFYPEHFLPDAVKKRHQYAYLPFSAGPRSCVGKAYAYMALKIILTSILKEYVVCADGTIEDITLKADISVRTKNKQYPIRIEKRK